MIAPSFGERTDTSAFTIVATPTPTPPIIVLPQPHFISINANNKASNSNVAFAEVVYHPTNLPYVAGYKLWLRSTVTITSPYSSNVNIASFVPVYLTGSAFRDDSGLYATVKLLLGAIPVVDKAVDAYGIGQDIYTSLHNLGSDGTISNSVVKGGNVELTIPVDYTNSMISSTQGRYFIQLVSTSSTPKWQIRAITESSYTYVRDEAYKGTYGTPPSQMTGVFREDIVLTW
ncbi:Uncharacterised protein [uncultured archaeon]|nr:Uncharacterised protein [uncultured archaeon]